MDPKKCKIKVEPHPILGVQIIAKGDCADELSFLDELKPRKRDYFKRRIKFEP